MGTDKMIYVQPPEGKYWVILQGSLSIERPLAATVIVWTDSAPYAPYRDPETGEMRGCYRCVNLIKADASTHTFFPIVGGYTEGLQGQTMPLVISYPNRLNLVVTPTHGGLPEPLQAWARFTIVEKDLN